MTGTMLEQLKTWKREGRVVHVKLKSGDKLSGTLFDYDESDIMLTDVNGWRGNTQICKDWVSVFKESKTKEEK